MAEAAVAGLRSGAAARLLPVLERAAARARLLRRPVLASLALPWPVGLLPRGPSAAGGLPYCLWEDATRALRLFGAGEAVALAAVGGRRFRAVHEQTSRLFSEAVVDAEPALLDVPLCFSAFAFDAAAPPAEEWSGFPAAKAFVPRLLFAHRDADACVVLSLLVHATSDAATAAAGLVADLDALLAPGHPAGLPSTAVARAVGAADVAGWQESVDFLAAAISRGDVEKVVLARRVELIREGGFDLDAAVERLRQRYAGCTLFAFGRADACFLGATPEMLVRLEAGTVATDCLAGSAPRAAVAAEDEAIGLALLQDDKELREHAFVRDFQLRALEPLCSHIQAPAQPVLRRMANVQHLYTPIRATPRPRHHVLDFVEALHPTPATAGVPAERALCLIRRLEPFSRGWYAGPLGWLDAAGNGEFAVGLRSALVRGERALLYAGCGIVAGSDAGKELEESRIKLQAMTWALGAEDGSGGAEGARRP